MQGREVTKEQLETFLIALRRQYGNVSAAAKKAGFSRHAAYAHKKTDTQFSKQWDEILDGLIDDAEKELHRRAVKGTLKPVFYKGEKIGSIRQFSDRLLEFLLKAKRPEQYRDKLDLDTNIRGSLDIGLDKAIDQIYGDDEE